MNKIGDKSSYKCNIFQIMILQLHTIGGNGGGLLPVYDGKYGDGSDPNSIWPNTQIASGQMKLQSKVWHY